MWFLLALGSAIFAALTSILAKIGIEGVGSNLATVVCNAAALPVSGAGDLPNRQKKRPNRDGWVSIIIESSPR